MSGPDLAIIFLIFLIAFSLDLALWRSILMVKQFNGARETSRKEGRHINIFKIFHPQKAKNYGEFFAPCKCENPKLESTPPPLEHSF